MGLQSKNWRRPSPDVVDVSAAGGAPGTREHLNSRRLPTDAQAKTDFKYLSTDGTVDAAYLKANP